MTFLLDVSHMLLVFSFRKTFAFYLYPCPRFLFSGGAGGMPGGPGDFGGEADSDDEGDLPDLDESENVD